uniref:Ribbon-helix-helix protein CopG domain-containing protein n=1 Tax=Acidobacterium capsulatum TaxID=33075 RepID=A0A7V4XT03_9BACT
MCELCHIICGHNMSTQRTHILLPEDLISEIDALVGPRRRSAFLVETARTELRRRKLLQYLDGPEPAWREEDHHEIGKDASAWVASLRAGSDARIASPKKRGKH